MALDDQLSLLRSFRSNIIRQVFNLPTIRSITVRSRDFELSEMRVKRARERESSTFSSRD